MRPLLLKFNRRKNLSNLKYRSGFTVTSVKLVNTVNNGPKVPECNAIIRCDVTAELQLLSDLSDGEYDV